VPYRNRNRMTQRCFWLGSGVVFWPVDQCITTLSGAAKGSSMPDANIFMLTTPVTPFAPSYRDRSWPAFPYHFVALFHHFINLAADPFLMDFGRHFAPSPLSGWGGPAQPTVHAPSLVPNRYVPPCSPFRSLLAFPPTLCRNCLSVTRCNSHSEF